MCSQVSIARWGLIACPNDVRKHDKLVAWMLQRTDRVQEAYRQLRAEGLLALCNDLAVENGLLAQHSDY